MLVLPVCRWLRPICRSRLTSRGAWELAAPGSWAPRLSSAMKKRSFSHSLAVPKARSPGKFRPIFNLKHFNKYIENYKFKLKGFCQVRD